VIEERSESDDASGVLDDPPSPAQDSAAASDGAESARDRNRFGYIDRFVGGVLHGIASAPRMLKPHTPTAADDLPHDASELSISNDAIAAAAQGGDLNGKLATIEDRQVFGYIDRFVDGLLEGWAIAPKNPGLPVFAQCVVNGRPFLVKRADDPRPDVGAAGYGSKTCGFSFDLLPALNKLKLGEPLTIEIYAGHETLTKLGEWTSDWRATFGLYGEVSKEKIAKLTSICLRILAESETPDEERDVYFTDAESDGADAEASSVPPAFEKMFAPTTTPTTVRAMMGGAAPLPSGYIDYVRYRYKVDRSIQLGLSSAENDDLMRWYLAAYLPMRAWRRAPLSAQELKYLNGPGDHKPSTRAMCYYLPDPLKGKNDSAEHRFEIAYWWAVEHAPTLHAEDCLVPAWCVESLRQIHFEWRSMPFNLNFFIERYFSKFTELHFLDMHQLGDRVLFYLYMIVQAVRRPDLLRFMPREPLQRLLETRVADASGEQRGFDDLIFQVLGLSEWAFSLQRLRSAARKRMFDIDEMRFRTLSPGGHRCLGAALPLPARSKTTDIQMIGPFLKASGLGQAARRSAEMIARGGFRTSAFDFGLDNPAPEGFSTAFEHGGLKHAKINLIHLNAESIPLVYAYMPDVFRSSYNIGYFYWELDTPANCHYLALELLDEIWVSSEYCRSTYVNATSKPVVNVGMCAEHLDGVSRREARAYVADRLGSSPDDFVFLSAFDSFSFIQRKNPISVIRAFRAAFPEDPRMRLVLKTHNRQFIGDPQQIRMWSGIEEEVGGDERITIINETLSYEELRKLKAGSDCFISLHRSEGWGFGMIEAMGSGIPVVATGYSGNMDFCTPETCWLVDYDLVCLYPEDYIFVVPGQKWAEPRLASAVAQMRSVAYDAGERARRVDAATRYVQANFSEQAITARYAARLRELMK
jgi:glycosyltransferase involved in cell wall biosynthesis